MYWEYYKTRNTGTPNNGTRNTSEIARTLRNNGGMPEQQWNSRNFTEQQQNAGITAEYRNNGTPQKLEPEGKHDIFHYLQFSLENEQVRESY